MYQEGTGVKNLRSHPVWTPGRYLHDGVWCPEGDVGVPLGGCALQLGQARGPCLWPHYQ